MLMSARSDALRRIQVATRALLEGVMISEGDTMALPLRKNSVVSQAMDGARTEVMNRLAGALKIYVDKVRQASYDMTTNAERTGFFSDFKKHRSSVLTALESFDAKLVEFHKGMDEAFEEYDLNVREIEAWLTATQAADKIAGREPNNTIRPFSFSDLVRRP